MSRIFTHLFQNNQSSQIEIEVHLTPGIPSIVLIGYPDNLLKESIPKIHSAIRSAGFELPAFSKILVHLKPLYLKKFNQGLELPIAVAILRELGEIQLNSDLDWMIVGDLGLKGQVFQETKKAPIHIDESKFNKLSAHPEVFNGGSFLIEHLAELKNNLIYTKNTSSIFKRPKLLPYHFNQNAAQILGLVAYGRHHILLGGSSGSGKSFLLKNISQLMTYPNNQDSIYLNYENENLKSSNNYWRPQVEAHHSLSLAGLIGGGNHLGLGDLQRAQGGILIMDEFLEFKPEILEALREPLDRQKIRISRAGQTEEYSTDFILAASTNFCTCGNLSPESQKKCRCSQQKLRNYLHRLSGPVLERFQVLDFTDNWIQSEKKVSLNEILNKIEQASLWQAKLKRPCVNSQLGYEFFCEGMDFEYLNQNFQFHELNERRKLFFLRVARSLADLALSDEIQHKHFMESYRWTVQNFKKLDHLCREVMI